MEMVDKRKMNFKESILIFLRGLFMGIADIIPGVSGGTIALITGIYERLVHAISEINKLIIKNVFRAKIRNAFVNIKKLDFPLFIPLIIGIALAFITLSHLMSYLLLVWTGLTYAFFFGLILASAIFVYKQASDNHAMNLIPLILGIVFGLFIVSLKALQANHSLLIIFLSGAIGICAMILPGISGAFILLILNQYEYMINVIKNLVLDKLLVFLIGAGVGILSFSKLLDYLLEKHKGATMAFLTGLMLGSLKLPVVRMFSSPEWFGFKVITGLFGFVIVFIIERKFTQA